MLKNFVWFPCASFQLLLLQGFCSFGRVSERV